MTREFPRQRFVSRHPATFRPLRIAFAISFFSVTDRGRSQLNSFSGAWVHLFEWLLTHKFTRAMLAICFKLKINK